MKEIEFGWGWCAKSFSCQTQLSWVKLRLCWGWVGPMLIILIHRRRVKIVKTFIYFFSILIIIIINGAHWFSFRKQKMEFREGLKNKNETYYRSERNLFLTIRIYFKLSESLFNYLNLFLTIWIHFHLYDSIFINLNMFLFIWIYV